MKPISLMDWCVVYPKDAAEYIADLRDILEKLIKLDDGDTPYWWGDKPREMMENARKTISSKEGKP